MDDKKTYTTEETRDEMTRPGTSPLMIGSGKVRKSNATEMIELHLDENEITNLVTNRSKSRNMFPAGQTDRENTKDINVSSPRMMVEARLPKTYITRSGSLLLFSDSKVTDEKRPSVEDYVAAEGFQVQGHKLTPRPFIAESYPQWGKLVNQKRTCTTIRTTDSRQSSSSKRVHREYIGLGVKVEEKKPYSWNYSVLPLKILNTRNNADIRTVNNLSEAVLAYRGRSPSDQDKYLSMIKQTWHDTRPSARRRETVTEQFNNLSPWTREWVQNQRSVALQEPIPILVKRRHKRQNVETDTIILEQARTTLVQSQVGRVPVNTPLHGSKQTARQAYTYGYQSFSPRNHVTANSPRRNVTAVHED